LNAVIAGFLLDRCEVFLNTGSSLWIINYGSDLSVCTPTTGNPLSREKQANHQKDNHTQVELDISSYDPDDAPGDNEEKGRFNTGPKPAPIVQSSPNKLPIYRWCRKTDIWVENFVHGRFS